jgi:hypothetical protein
MSVATASAIARLETMTITKVVERFELLFGEKCRSQNKRYLIARIARRLHANAEGDLSERAQARAAELTLDFEVRVVLAIRLDCEKLPTQLPHKHHFLERVAKDTRSLISSP